MYKEVSGTTVNQGKRVSNILNISVYTNMQINEKLLTRSATIYRTGITKAIVAFTYTVPTLRIQVQTIVVC